ncbi:hypothetical protein [Mesorhizobium sp. LNJC394B00]|uniref:hypothetical protein n=1 Tax=Mesorhizobium sp. LNJC394B00 TaxID=1287274 RepID=UPI00041796ED|nr:hypothetical protein [Mesorhizobium sp. LNJC394B00]
MYQHVHRRALIAASTGAACALAVAGPHSSAIAAPESFENFRPDPAFAALDRLKAADRALSRSHWRLENAEARARPTHGFWPSRLIAWRHYSAIGGREIEKARIEFLGHPGADLVRIEEEYHDAKKRYRAALRAGDDWDRRAGLTEVRSRAREAGKAFRRETRRLAQTQATTPAGAAAMIDFVARDMQTGDTEWHLPALKAAAVALRKMA